MDDAGAQGGRVEAWGDGAVCEGGQGGAGEFDRRHGAQGTGKGEGASSCRVRASGGMMGR